jgi:non-homologous end joining protein Ku
VPVSEDELESLEAEANRSIDLKQFIPLASVDPVYFENSHYSRRRQRRGEALPAAR